MQALSLLHYLAGFSSMKLSNIKRHFGTCHATFASKYPEGDSRKKACLELIPEIKASQHQLCAWTQKGDCNSASFAASLAIVKNQNSFTDCCCCIVHIYPPFTRKRIVSLYFGREVRTRLGVAISEMSGPPVFHVKAGASR